MIYTYFLKTSKLNLLLFFLLLTRISTAQDKNSFDRIVTMSSPWFVDFADLNGDQILDMVGVNGNSNADIEIYHGNADGVFELKTTLQGSGEYYAVFLQHLNADNVPDIVALSNISGIIFLSSPSGYVSLTSIPGSGPFSPTGTLFGDFNNDGALDLFIKNELLINHNNGTFTSKTFIVGNGGALATDFNNDNFLDIVMTNPGNGTVSFYQGNGDGTFQTPLTKTASVQEAIAYDLNADGFVDILAKGYDGEVIIFYNDATFSFSQTTTFQLNHNLYSTINIFDIDHNGTADFVTSNDNHIQYRPILPDGSFGNETTFNVGLGTLRGLIVRDAIGEPFPDLIAMSGFGTTKIHSDKLNGTLQFTQTEKIYDALPFATFYQASHAIASATVSYSEQAAPPTNVGSYEVTIQIVDPHYEGELKGTVSITKKTLTVGAVDVSIMQGEPIPSFELSYAGFVGSENSAVLTQQPIAGTTATLSSEPGEYEITISGADDENYKFDYRPGVLTVTEIVTAIAEDIMIDLFPNPAVDKVMINSPHWTTLKIYDLNGRNVVTKNYSNEEISFLGCPGGVYILQVQFKNGNTLQQKILIN